MFISSDFADTAASEHRVWPSRAPHSSSGQRTHGAIAGSAFNLLESDVIRIALMEGDTPLHPSTAKTRLGRVFQNIATVLVGDRRKGPLADERLEALRRFAAAARSGRGALDRSELRRFFRAGYNVRQALEVSLLVAAATISGTDTPSWKLIDDALVDGVRSFSLPARINVSRDV